MPAKRGFNRSILLLLLFSAIAFFGPNSAADAEGASKKVLILHWQDAFSIGVMNVDQILYEDLLNGLDEPIEFYSEYLQFSKFTNMDIQTDVLDLLKKKYSDLDLDLIITTDDPDYQFAISYRDELFPEVPIVFIGVNKDTVFASQVQPATTGNYKMIDIDTSIANIEQLFPDTKNLVVVSGAGRQDAQYYRILKEGLMPYSDKYNITYTVDMTLPQVLDLVGQLPQQTCVLYTSMFNDASGKGYSPSLVAAEISSASGAPVFVYSPYMVGSGAIGGNVVDFASLAHDGANRALQILNGALPSAMPVKTPNNQNYFDAAVLKKYGIQNKTLPHGSVILGQDGGQAAPSFDIGLSGSLIYLFLGVGLGAGSVLLWAVFRRPGTRSGKL